MHGEGFFFQAFVYLLAAVVAVPVAKRLGMGSVLGYLVAGVAIGPFGLALVGREGQDVLHYAEFGVVMMLFLVGLELEPERMWRLRGALVGLGGLQVSATAAVIVGVGMALGLKWQAAVAIGLILSLSSTAIVLQSLAEKGILRTAAGENSLAVLLFQDIAVIPMLALLPLLATAPAGAGGAVAVGSLEGLPAWARGLAILGAVTAVVLAGRFLVVPALRLVARTRVREMLTAAALLLVIAAALVATRVGLSAALGTFLAGVVLANSEYRHELETDLEPFNGLLLGLFFIAVGSSIDFGLVARSPLLVAGLLASLVAVKFAVLFVLGRIFRMGLDQNLLFAFALAQVGEFAFVLLSFAMRTGVVSHELGGLMVAVTALSMASTPIVMLLHERLVDPWVGTTEAPERESDVVDEDNPVVIAGFGSFGQIVGRLLFANGVGATVLDVDSDRVDLLRKLGFKVFYGDASRADLLRAAGAEKAKILVVAVEEPAKTLEIIETAKKHFPNLRLFVRARGREDAYQLLEGGVEHVYRETLDTSLELGTDLLQRLGFRAYQARRAARTFRRHDEDSVRELARLRHDRQAYLVRARERIAELEQIIQGELAARGGAEDEGWDTETLRKEFGETSRER